MPAQRSACKHGARGGRSLRCPAEQTHAQPHAPGEQPAGSPVEGRAHRRRRCRRRHRSARPAGTKCRSRRNGLRRSPTCGTRLLGGRVWARGDGEAGRGNINDSLPEEHRHQRACLWHRHAPGSTISPPGPVTTPHAKPSVCTGTEQVKNSMDFQLGRQGTAGTFRRPTAAARVIRPPTVLSHRRMCTVPPRRLPVQQWCCRSVHRRGTH